MSAVVQLRSIVIIGIYLLAAILPASARDPQSYDDLDHPMLTDPDLTIPPPVRTFEEPLATLWTDALLAPEADLRRHAAETIAVAHAAGMSGLESAIPNLTKVAGDPQENSFVRYAAVRALVALDAQSSADLVFTAVVDLGLDVEADAAAALARWKHQGIRTLWNTRLSSADASHRELLLAINGIAALEDRQQNQLLKTRIVDPYSPFDVRLAAARALATLEAAGLESFATELLDTSDGSRRQRLLAAALLRQHSGTAAEELLQRLALDNEPAVAGAALERLLEIAPARIEQHQAQLLTSRDANVRRFTVQAVALFPTAANTISLAHELNDVNPNLRVLARNHLFDFATKHNLRDAVLHEAEQLLVQQDWRGIEQACRLVGLLDHKPAAMKVVHVLPHLRTEVNATAAWALRKLAVPETLPEILTIATSATDNAMGTFMSRSDPRDYDAMFTQIFQFFAAMDYKPADLLLRRYIPKLSMTPPSRCAAIWALGHIHKDQPPAELISALEERLLDVNVSLPEQELVRCYCAISLGRMKAESVLPTLRHFYELGGSVAPSSYGCGWAIEQITGEPVKKPEAPVVYIHGWFLEPY